MTQTLTQQITRTRWHRLTRQRMEALLTEWSRYMSPQDILRLIWDSNQPIPNRLIQILVARDWFYDTVYDRECEDTA